MRFSKFIFIKQVSFKNRNRNKVNKIKFIFGDTAFLIIKNVQFEFIYFFIIKRFLKYFFKFKYSIVNYYKIWVNLKANFPVSRKIKNSRMGKGKGLFNRWLIKLNQNFILLELKNINFIRVKNLIYYWNKLLNFSIYIIKKN